MTEPSDDQLRQLGTIAFRIAFRLLGSRQDAEDVAQEAVTRTAIRWRRVHGHAEPFVGRVATNLAIGILRKRRPATGSAGTVDGGFSVAADRIDLIEALRGLPSRQREVVVLRFIGDYSERDIAATLGCSPGSVKTHCARGLAALRLAPPTTPFTAGALDES
jgi:RNA polymerase sigma factor (sigma-70 family)